MSLFSKMNLESLLNYQANYPDTNITKYINKEAEKVPINILAISQIKGPNDYIPALVTVGWFNNAIIRINNDQFLSVTKLDINFFDIINQKEVEIGFKIKVHCNHYYAEPVYINNLNLTNDDIDVVSTSNVRLGSIIKPETDYLLFNMLYVDTVDKTDIYKNFLIALNDQTYYTY